MEDILRLIYHQLPIEARGRAERVCTQRRDIYQPLNVATRNERMRLVVQDRFRAIIQTERADALVVAGFLHEGESLIQGMARWLQTPDAPVGPVIFAGRIQGFRGNDIKHWTREKFIELSLPHFNSDFVE